MRKKDMPERGRPKFHRRLGGDDREPPLRVNFFMNKCRKLGFIDYNGKIIKS